MSDPLEERFRDFTTGTPAVSPASPAEIRGRGDRLRRRRTALTAAGAALAVALVATPIAVLATGDDDDVRPAPTPSTTITDPPSENPTPSVPTRIPDDFPLAAGYPETNEDGTPVEVTTMPGVESIAPCDRSAWAPPDGGLDLAGATYLGPEDGRSRTLVVYPDADAASAALTGIRDGVTACPTQGDEVDGSTWAEVDTPWNADSLVVTRRYLTQGLPNPGLDVYQAVRVGKALLVDVNSGEGGATDESVVSFTAAVVEQADPVVAAMATFAEDPSEEEPTSPDPSRPQLPEYFLPEAGELPTRDRLTPWEEVETTDERLVGCQPDVGLGADEIIQRSYTARIAPADGLPGGEDVAAEVKVSILQYGSEADAEAAEAAVTGWIRDCDAPTGFDRAGATRQGDLVETPQAGTYATWVYGAPETCGDSCDAAWFDRMGVLADLGRMVVVSFREVGGPLEPEGLDATMADLMLRVAGGSMPG